VKGREGKEPEKRKLSQKNGETISVLGDISYTDRSYYHNTVAKLRAWYI